MASSVMEKAFHDERESRRKSRSTRLIHPEHRNSDILVPCSSSACLSKQAQQQLEIHHLRERVMELETENIVLKGQFGETKHCVVPSIFSVGSDTTEIHSFGRNVSLQTQHILRSIPKDLPDHVAEHVSEAFVDPLRSLAYFHSIQFAHDLIQLSHTVSRLFEVEDRCVAVESPAYVFGDIHGNLDDLKFFADNIWRFGMNLSAGRFVFLGDYVDRGLSSLECIAYLFSLKIKHPNKLLMLRGNHEVRCVNGWESHYGIACFLAQCKQRFGDEGHTVWEQVNEAFDRMPIAAVIDDDIFCVHGGIPRPIKDTKQIESIRAIPAVARLDDGLDISLDGLDLETNENEEQMQLLWRVARDCLWADPAPEEKEDKLDKDGYGPSLRGGDAIMYGHIALENFLQTHGYSYLIRAHEAQSEGIGISKAAKVLTVFSTSKDHGLGANAKCGCVLIENDQIFIMNRSTRYRTQREQQQMQITKMKMRSRSYEFQEDSYDESSTDEEFPLQQIHAETIEYAASHDSGNNQED